MTEENVFEGSAAALCEALLAETRAGRVPLLMLPSCAAAFELVAELKRHSDPICIGTQGLTEHWHEGAGAWVMSPLRAWGRIKASGQVTGPIAVFQDQLTAMDDSYLTVTIEGRACHVSPIEAMVAMKYATTLYAGEMTRGPVTPTLRLRAVALPCGGDGKPDARAVMMASAKTALAAEPFGDHWHARHIFPLKLDDNFRNAVLSRFQQLDSLTRLYRRRDRASGPRILAWQSALKAARQAFASPADPP